MSLMRRIRLTLMALLLLGLSISGQASEKTVVITVDDLPIAGGGLHASPEERLRITEGLLAALKRHQIQAVGLVTWGNVRQDGDLDLLDRWLEEGHELGNHSFHHPNYNSFDSETYIADIEAGRQKLASFLEERGKKIRFFRFPYLREGDTRSKLLAMRRYLGESNQQNLPVTLDNADWSFEHPWTKALRARDQDALERIGLDFQKSLRLSIRHQERLSEQLFKRSVPQILLLHANAVGVAQWDALFIWLKERGYRFATADEALVDPAFSEEHEYVAERGFGLWDRLIVDRGLQKARQDIEQLLTEQADAWNRGDLQDFTSVYADETIFLSPSGKTVGREAVLTRYQKRYPDRAAMGTLTLEIEHFEPIWGIERSMVGDARPGGVHGASVVGRWRLSYPEGAERTEASGPTLLVFKRQSGTWKIVQDASM